jgi:hypothetical protein
MLGCFFAALFFFTPSDSRTSAGRIIRWAKGEHLYKQYINDLAENVRKDKSLTGLQPWAEELLQKYQHGEAVTNGISSYELVGPVVDVSPNEVPGFLRASLIKTNGWGEEEPSIFIKLSAGGEPECVILGWYQYGLAVGNTNYTLTFDAYKSVEAKPGIYAYYFYK